MNTPWTIRIVSSVLIFACSLQVTTAALLPPGGEIQVGNVSARIEGDSVIITYDLIGTSADSCRVLVQMLKKGDPAFRYVLKSGVDGAIGDAQKPGFSKTITWNFRQEFPDGLADGEFYFVVGAELLTQKKAGSNFWWYAGGGAFVVGGALYLILSKKIIEKPDLFLSEPGRPYP